MAALWHKHKFAILLKVAKLSRATCYYHAKRLSAPDKYAEWVAKIQTIYTEHKGRVGYRRIKAKLKGLSPTLHRHTTASLLIASGTDVATVASLLGHAQVSTTLDIYTHAFDKNRKRAAEGLHKGLGV